MNFKSELNDRVSGIEDWVSGNKIGKTKEKNKNIAKEMFWCVIKHDIDPDDIRVIRDKISREPFTIEEGNIWERLLTYFDKNRKYVAFFRDINELTPTGLNTSPNACCGKSELLFRLLRPNSRQPKKGDIVDDGIICEIKGSGVRVLDTELTGVTYRKKCSKIFDGHISGNVVKTGGLKGSNVYEIEKKQHRTHYQTEFGKDVRLSKRLLQEYFNENGWECSDADIDGMFRDTVWDQEIFKKKTLREMFIKYKAKMKFDKMYIFGDGTDIKIISEPEDLDKVQILEDYFRINQTTNVGWYIGNSGANKQCDEPPASRETAVRRRKVKDNKV